MKRHAYLRRAVFACTITLLSGARAASLPAPALRDPMHPPATRASVAAGASGAEGTPLQAHQLLIVDGKRYVVEGLRRRTVGEQLLSGARIERIEDSAVVVIDPSGARRRLPLFAGVVKRPIAASTPTPLPLLTSALPGPTP
jgi:hypothetical protein